MTVLLDFFFFFQAEDGIRDSSVTGVQTCALPICSPVEERRTSFLPPCSTRQGSFALTPGSTAANISARDPLPPLLPRLRLPARRSVFRAVHVRQYRHHPRCCDQRRDA